MFLGIEPDRLTLPLDTTPASAEWAIQEGVHTLEEVGVVAVVHFIKSFMRTQDYKNNKNEGQISSADAIVVYVYVHKRVTLYQVRTCSCCLDYSTALGPLRAQARSPATAVARLNSTAVFATRKLQT